MAIELISKIKPKNNGNFKLVDVEDIEYNGKGLDEAIQSGEFKGEKGDPGEPGQNGQDGTDGAPGKDGAPGPKGADGKSAYQIAVDGGFEGSEQDWLASLKGEKGEPGQDGTDGAPGQDGAAGPKGDNGKSAYQIALDGGFKGSEEEWLASLKGEKGEAGQDGAPGPKGDQGEPGQNGQDGATGPKGDPGKSAYDYAVEGGYQGTEEEFAKSVAGEYSDAIMNTATGDLLVIKDSSDRKNKGFGMTGKTEQVSTTGKKLLDDELLKTLSNYTSNGKDYYYYRFSGLEIGKRYTLSRSNIKSGSGALFGISVNQESYDSAKFLVYDGLGSSYNNVSITWSQTTGEYIDILFSIKSNVAQSTQEKLTEFWERLSYVQLEEGSTATANEPYTGGKPSPSPEYPQEIVNAGRLNEDTGKYEIDVNVNGINILDENHFFDMGNWKKNIYHMNLKPDTKYTFIRKDNSGAGSAMFLMIKDTVEDPLSQIVNSNSAIMCKQQVTFTTNDSGKIYFSLQNNNKLNLKDFLGFAQLEVGTVASSYEPYKEQTLTLTSDRPITKWDKLVEQEGQIGWLYNTGEIMLSEITLWSIQKDNLPDNRTQRIYAILNNAIKNQHCYATKYYSEEPSASSIKLKDYECIAICNGNYLTLKVDRNIGTTSEDYVNYFGENDDKVIYNSTDQEFVPLPQEQQDAIRALATYYPTTVVSNSEDMEMELTYVADTKNYTDRKIEQAVSAQIQNTANLLSLMPDDVQAAMIENDTNRILESEVVE